MKSLLAGAALAAVAGLLMGAAAKPDLGWDDRPAGPQILAGWGGGRSSGPFDDGASYVATNGQIPDYVLGTDWKRMLTPPSYTPEPSPAREPRETRLASNGDVSELPVTRVASPEPPHAAPSYPSMDGGQPAAEPNTQDDSAPTG